jgi:hypothetical protein
MDIAGNANSDIWIVGKSGIEARSPGGTVHFYGPNDVEPLLNRFGEIFISSDVTVGPNNKVAVLSGSALGIRDPSGTWTFLRQTDLPPEFYPASAAIDDDGYVWIASSSGVARRNTE